VIASCVKGICPIMNLGEVLHDVLEFIEDKQLSEGAYLAISNEMKGVFKRLGKTEHTPLSLSIYGKASELGVRVVIDFKALQIDKDDWYESLIVYDIMMFAEKKQKEKNKEGSVTYMKLGELLDEYLGRYKIETIQITYEDIPVDFQVTNGDYHNTIARWIMNRIEYLV